MSARKTAVMRNWVHKVVSRLAFAMLMALKEEMMMAEGAVKKTGKRSQAVSAKKEAIPAARWTHFPVWYPRYAA